MSGMRIIKMEVRKNYTEVLLETSLLGGCKKGEIMRRMLEIVFLIALLMPTGMTESDECIWGGYMSLTEIKREPGFVTMYWRIFLEEDASSAARVIRDVATSADRIAVLFGMSTMEQYTGDQIDGSYLLNVYDSDGNYLYGYAVKTNLALDWTIPHSSDN